ncbi:hypothetical protein F2Q70_00007664 [Brassica cretica]|uniref:RRM domain-containing protein n=1 Tax=Brassica cretica TaxID=69181 RepID=A0A8S9MAT7_BRACR|nr:hypothetical protein F2Q70_00007664 [Brassica cretica]
MTMEDANSVYVGGLPYDVTEEALRRVFSTYGTVVDIKVDFPHLLLLTRKCYGFVTFSNRRSADDAIQDMDGKIIGGRAVRVNEVTTRFGGQGRFQPQSPSDGRSDFGYERDRLSDRRRAYERSHGFEGRNDHGMLDRDGYKERGFEEGDWRGDRSFEDNGRGVHRASSDEETKREDSTMLDGGRGRDGKDHFSNSSGDRSFQVKEELEALIKTHDVLQDESWEMEEIIDEFIFKVLVMEERLEVKEVLCSELEKKSKRLEDLLSNEKKLTSQRRKELAKVNNHRITKFSLVNSAAREGVAGADEGLENGYVQYKV